ncbi:hypothetical protein KEM56_001510 [Ascosphaera pollenicola]|nr:hypothetical protein KEM56_001510 [Ascosphaera pollenicola]
MAQGALKNKPKAPAAPAKKTGKLSKGARVYKPKKASLVKQQKVTKVGPHRHIFTRREIEIALNQSNCLRQKLTSGLAAKTERMLAERAGHLEMLAGGKKEKLETAQEKAKQRKH